jgi:Sec-independent protein translocase protein TatA
LRERNDVAGTLALAWAFIGQGARMSDPNINPYFDNPAAPSAPIVDVPPPAVGDSGMPGWMPIAAPFVGLGLFAIVAIVAFVLTGTETPPTQGAQQAATQSAKTNAAQPDAAATAARQQQQKQQAQPAQPQQQTQSQQQATPALPQNSNPPATTGSPPKQ